MFKSGAKKVDAAFGMFDKALKKLERARAACHAEESMIEGKMHTLGEKKLEARTASGRATTAITNINKLIGA